MSEYQCILIFRQNHSEFSKIFLKWCLEVRVNLIFCSWNRSNARITKITLLRGHSITKKKDKILYTWLLNDLNHVQWSVSLESKSWRPGFFQKKTKWWGIFQYKKNCPSICFGKNPGQHRYFFSRFFDL